MTDKAIEAAVEAARAKRHELIAQPLERVYDQVVRAVIAAYEQAMWRPIEEAPEDGTEFLALNCRAVSVGYRVVYFDDEAREPHIWHVEDAGKGFNHHRSFFTPHRPIPPPPGKEG